MSDVAYYGASVFFTLLTIHALCDYPLQGEFLSRFKNPDTGTLNGETVWPTVLFMHALIHGGGVYAATGRLEYGIVETVLHTLIDYGKCRRWYGFNTDQALHVLCKIMYVAGIAAL